MRFEEHVDVPVSVAEAWDFLWQAERLAACLPGCTHVEEVEAGKTYRAAFQDAIGPYKVHFDLDIAVQEARPQHLVRLLATGQDKRLGTSQRVEMDVALRPVSHHQTALEVTADVQILGKVATLGQFAIKRKAKDVVQRFAQNIQAELQPQARGTSHA